MASPAAPEAASARDGGSVLLLMPAAVLIVVVLAALAVDHALLFLAQRQLADSAAAAANDAVTFLVDEGALRRSGDYTLSVAQARSLVTEWVDAHRLPLTVTAVEVAPRGSDGLAVTLAAQVDLVFEPALPGGRRSATVTASAEAHALPS